MRNENQGKQKYAVHKQNMAVSCLKQGSKMNGFCLKKGQGLKASAAYPTQTSLNKNKSPPGGGAQQYLGIVL